jgi:hypothetical protein
MDKFWMSRKFWYAMAALGAFLALTLTGTMVFTSEQTINFILAVFGINVGAHALTDISSIIGHFFGSGNETAESAEIELFEEFDDESEEFDDESEEDDEEDDDRPTPNETPIPRGVHREER